MGIIIAKFRKKKTTYEVLEKLENEIQSIEEFGRSTEQTQKKMVGRFIFVSICVYCLTALILYFYFFPASAYERLIYIIPLIILPVLLIFIKRILTWHYSRKIRKNQTKLTTLKNEKKKILEEVMDKETYKVAKTILDKFAPEQNKKNISIIASQATPAKSGSLATLGSGSSSLALSQTGLRYRGQFGALSNTPALGASATPRISQSLKPAVTPGLSRIPPAQPQSVVRAVGYPVGTGPSTPLVLPRAILPRERTVLDKMVDYLVGDGPSNRYALICRNCSSHNGMALREEFDYLSFKCCYCLAFNPSRKQRPAAPKLDVSLSIKHKQFDTSGSEQSTPNDTESESEAPIITEPPDEDDPVENNKTCSPPESEQIEESGVKVKQSENELSDMEIDYSLTHANEENIDHQDNESNQEESATNESNQKFTTEDTQQD